MKTLVIYVPITWATISRRFFESWVKMTGPAIQDQLATEFDVRLVPMVETRFPLDVNRNQAIDRALNDYHADFIQFIDADMVFPEDAIPRLMRHLSNETPVAAGIYWLKKPPYRCIAGKYLPWTDDLRLKKKSLESQGFIAPDGTQTLYYQSIRSYDVIEPVDVAGMGCVLARADVFKRLKQPYFKYVNEYSTGGDFTFSGGSSEEMWFYSELKKAGIKTLLDPTIRCGHLHEVVFGSNQGD